MGGEAAPGGEDPLGEVHPGDVLGGGLGADEDGGKPLGVEALHGLVGEGGVAHRGPGACGEALEEGPWGLVPVHAGPEEAGEGVGLHPHDRLLPGDEPLLGHLHGDPHRRLGRALARAGLEEEKPSPLHGELKVLHVAEVPLQALRHLEELLVEPGGVPFKALQGLGGADARHHVLPLGVPQVLPVEALLPGGGVAGEAHPGARVLPQVAEDHGLDHHRRAQVLGDAVDAAVGPGPGVLPAPEYGLNGSLELGPGVQGEGGAAGPEVAEVAVGELLQVLGPKGRVRPHPLSALRAESIPSKTSGPSPKTTSPYMARSLRRLSQAKRGLPVARARASTPSRVRPRLRTVSIIPGMETGAPLRTETRRGGAFPSPRPKRLPVRPSRAAIPARTSPHSPGTSPAFRYWRQASVVTMKAGGTGRPAAAISARPWPLPPKRSRESPRASESK